MHLLKKISIITVTIFLLCYSAFSFALDIYFSNLVWHVRDGYGAPGPNFWSSNNAWVDRNGWLHLRISRVGNRWYCASIVSDKPMGFGEYWFYTTGRLDSLDRNAIVGLFHYAGPDGANEIDMEFGRWGTANRLPGTYVVYPTVVGPAEAVRRYNFSQTNNSLNMTSGYVWSNRSVLFRTGFGHNPQYPDLISSWNFAPANYTRLIPQRPMPLYMNLWLVGGNAPMNGRTQEIIIKRFCYKPRVGRGNC